MNFVTVVPQENAIRFVDTIPGSKIDVCLLHAIVNRIRVIQIESKVRGFEFNRLDDIDFPWEEWQLLHEYKAQCERVIKG